MSNEPESPRHDPALNPALRSRTDATHDTTSSSPAPADSASVQREEGRAWPLIWMVVVLLGVILAAWLLFG